MLTHEIEARKRLHDHVMEDSDRRRSGVPGREAEPTVHASIYIYIYTRVTARTKTLN